MTIFKSELEKITNDFEDKKFIGRAMYINLNNDLKVKAEFYDSSTLDRFDQLNISLISKTNGVLDKVNVELSDVLGTDTIKNPHFYNFGNREPKWSNINPTEEDYQILANQISDFCEFYMDQDKDFQMGGI